MGRILNRNRASRNGFAPALVAIVMVVAVDSSSAAASSATCAITSSTGTFYPGCTFEDRKQAYVNDQGDKWRASFVNDKYNSLFAWLETQLEAKRQGLSQAQWDTWKPYTWTDPATGAVKKRSQLISDGIEYFTNAGWWTGALPGGLTVPRIYFQYYQDPATRVIVDQGDIDKLDQRMNELGTGVLNDSTAVWCAVANWNFPNLIGAYLYNSRIANIGPTPYPTADATYHCPPPFSYNGHSYVGGQSYDGKTILRDYLELMMDDWLRNGTEEDLSSSTYYSFQIHSVANLVDFAPDATIRHKAKMLLDWLVFHYSVGVSAGHLAGGHGRHYDRPEWDGKDEFPIGILFNLNPDPMTRWSTKADLFVSSYRVPPYATDFFESINPGARREPDSYYRIIRGHNAALGDRYDYITPNYNLGGTKLGTHWELNVASGGNKPLKLFFCDGVTMTQDKACNSAEAYGGVGNLRYLFEEGQNGSQHRNALFMKGGSAVIHEVLEGQTWDESSSESGWEFRRNGNVAVAMRVAGSGALEVGTLGVDYPDYAAFKSAVKANCVLTSSSFKTSKGVTISDGYVDLGSDYSSLPFDRLEVWEGHVGANDERKVVDWSNNVMTVTRNGATHVYDFGAWSCTNCDTATPPPPSDTTAPTVALTAPAGGASLAGSATVAATAADNVSVVGVRFELDGAPLGAEDTSAPFTLAWDTAEAANGSHTLSAVARDAAGNTGASAAVTVTVSNAAPPPGFDENLARTSTLGAASPCFSGECWDNLIDADLSDWDGTVTGDRAGTPAVVLDLPGTTLYALSKVRLLTDTGVGFSERWVTQFRIQVSLDGTSYQPVLTGQKTTGAFEDFALPAGTQARYVKLLVDANRGDAAYVQAGELEVWGHADGTTPTPDTTPPSVSLSAPVGGSTVAGTAVTVAATASDNVGVAGVQFKLDGANLGTEDTAAPYAFVWNTTGVANGSHTLSALARDAAGNTSIATALVVTVSNASATVATPMISPNGGSFSTSVSVSLSTTTAGATIRYTTDGSDPTASSTLYGTAFSLTSSATVKAHAFKSGSTDSAVASAVFTIGVTTPSAGSYPLIGWQMFGGAVNDFYARFDLIVSRSNSADRARQIKALNPGMKILYTEDWNADCGLSLQSQWYLKYEDGTNFVGEGFYDHMMNLSDWAVPLGYHDACADRMTALDWSVFDGVATDGLYGGQNQIGPYSSQANWAKVDANGNQVDDHTELSNSQWQSHWQAGVDELLRKIRSRLPAGKLMVINSGYGHDWGWPWSNGIIVEKAGVGFDPVPDAGNYFRDLNAGTMDPFVTIFDGLAQGDDPALASVPALTSDPDRWGTPQHRSRDLLAGMRYGLALAMFNDAYYSHQDADGFNEHSRDTNGYIGQEHYWSFWYDEFEADLGTPTADEVELRSGLWYRCFEKGMVVANTDGTNKTVTASELAGKCGWSGAWWRLRSGQDLALKSISPSWPALHDGTQLTSVTLGGASFGGVYRGDGLILLQQPQTVVSDIVVDNNYMSTSPTNDWMVSSGFTQETDCGAGSDYYTVRCSWNPGSYPFAWTNTPSGSAVFAPTIGVAGSYEVFEWHGSVAGGASSVEHAVTHAGGTQSVFVNQTQNAGRWNSLGSFTFNAGSAGNVTIWARGASGTVMADAIKLEYRGNGQAPPSVATPTISPNGGSFSTSVSVSLSTTTAGATIRYTTDGSNPAASSTAYSAPFTLTSSATVKARAFKSGMTDSAVTTVAFTSGVNLKVTQADSPDPADAGLSLTYTLTVRNQHATGTATSVVLTDTLPASFGFVSASAPCSYAAPRVTCALGSLGPGAEATVTVVVTPSSAGTWTNSASVTAAEPEEAPADNSAAEATTVRGSPTLSVNDVAVAEGNAGSVSAVFTVSQSAPFPAAVSVDYAVTPLTAEAGDFTPAAGTLTIPVGATSVLLGVAVQGDLASEGNETFLVTLANAHHAVLADPQGIGSILDDDVAPQVAIAGVTVTEGDAGHTVALLRVTLSGSSGRPVKVRYATAGGTALSGRDFLAASGTVVFPEGTTRGELAVAVVADLLAEPSESFTVNLTNPENATVATAQAAVTIVDDDTLPALSVSDVRVTEGHLGSRNAVFRVSLSAIAPADVNVDWATADATARAGEDYLPSGGTLTIRAGLRSGSIVVPVLGDRTDERNEAFLLSLTRPGGARIVDGLAQGVVWDDDGVPDAATPIASLPYVATRPGRYRLAGDLVFAQASGAAIAVGANGVTLDLDGHVLRGSAGAATQAFGVLSRNRTMVAVENGGVEGFLAGVFLAGPPPYAATQGLVVRGVRARANTYAGVWLEGRGNLVDASIVSLTGGTTALGPAAGAVGIASVGPAPKLTGNEVRDTVAPSGGDAFAIAANGAVKGTVSGNLVKNTSPAAATGILVTAATGASVTANTLDTLDYGVVFAAAASGTCKGNALIAVAAPSVGVTCEP